MKDIPAPNQTTAVDPKDEFYAGIWWLWDVPGLGLRPATGTECADEIKRLREQLRSMHDHGC